MNTYQYANGAIRIEKIEKQKSTNTLTLPSHNLWIIAILIFIQLVFVAMAYGPIAAFLVELFPAKIRYTSLSLPYHIGNGVFGGLTPLIAETVVIKSGNIFAGLYYPITVALITVVLGVFLIQNKKRELGE